MPRKLAQVSASAWNRRRRAPVAALFCVVFVGWSVRPSVAEATLHDAATPDARIESNVSRARMVEDRFRSIALSDEVGPWAVCHAFLALGPDYELTDSATGQRIAARTLVLRRPAYALRGDSRFGFRRSIYPRTYERHPAQFASYLIASGLTPGSTGEDSDAGILARIWDHERFECHELRDMSWFMPAYCAVGDFEPFYTKFGEQFGPDDLVSALVAQSAEQDQPPSCGGLHLTHAVLEAERVLVHLLRPAVAKRLQDEAQRRRRAIERAVSDDGLLDASLFLEGDTGTQELRLVIAGHIVELASSGYEPPLLSNDKLHRLVDHVLTACLSLECWQTPVSLLTREGPFDYASASHLVRGLGLYREQLARDGLSHPVRP